MRNTYLAMDDKPSALDKLVRCLRQADENAEIRAFSLIASLQEEIKNGYRPTAAFLDIEMNSNLTGIEVARMLRSVSPTTDIVFVTEHKQYALEACFLHASGYILKPVTPQLIRAELQCLAHHPYAIGPFPSIHG